MITYSDKKEMWKAEGKTHIERINKSSLRDIMIRKRFVEKVVEMVDVGVPNLWGHFKDGVSKACD